MDDIAKCLQELGRVLEIRERKPDSLTASFQQMTIAVDALKRGLRATFEESFRLEGTDLERRVDVVLRDKLGNIVELIEGKSGEKLSNMFTGESLQELFKDLHRAMSESVTTTWALERVNIDERVRLYIQEKLEVLMRALRSLHSGDILSGALTELDLEMGLKRAFEQLRFVDAAGRIFKPALEYVFDENGPITEVALEQASGSPDFKPAMNVLFDENGKLAKAATGAAGAADLAPAFETLDSKLEESARHATAGVSLTAASAALEDEIEQSVGGAIRGAGDAAARISARELGDKIGDRASALGNALSSIPQLHRSVKELGAAWDKPNKSTEDYMALLETAGSAIGDAGNVIQSLTAFTGAASAAQTLFNIVLSANPIGLVVLAVVALIAEIALLIAYWDEIKAALRDNPWIGVVLALFSVIGVIVLVIAYWEEVKLAVLRAANFISIQAQRIGILLGQVWGAVTGGLESAGVSIFNAFTTIGVTTQNFFIGIINWILDKYNELADSAAGKLARLEKADLLPEVELEARLLPLPEAPEVDIDAVLRMPVTGGLEEQIGDQERAVAAARAEDEARRSGIVEPEAEAQQATPEASGPRLPDVSALAGAALAERPAVPEGAPPLPAAAGGGGPVTVNLGGVTVNLNAEKLEANASQMLSDEIVRALSERLGALLAEQNFRMGTRPA